MKDSENDSLMKSKNLTESGEPSTEPSPAPKNENNPFIPQMGLSEAKATWEMLVGFKKAILENTHWTGFDVQAVAMGLSWVQRMEAQYRVNYERMQENEKLRAAQVRDAIKSAGGKIKGEPNVVVN